MESRDTDQAHKHGTVNLRPSSSPHMRQQSASRWIETVNRVLSLRAPYPRRASRTLRRSSSSGRAAASADGAIASPIATSSGAIASMAAWRASRPASVMSMRLARPSTGSGAHRDEPGPLQMADRVRHRALGDLHGARHLLRRAVAAEPRKVVEHGELRQGHRARHHLLEGGARQLRQDRHLVEEAEHHLDVRLAAVMHS